METKKDNEPIINVYNTGFIHIFNVEVVIDLRTQDLTLHHFTYEQIEFLLSMLKSKDGKNIRLKGSENEFSTFNLDTKNVVFFS